MATRRVLLGPRDMAELAWDENVIELTSGRHIDAITFTSISELRVFARGLLQRADEIELELPARSARKERTREAEESSTLASADEVAQRLGTNPSRVYALARAGTLPCVRIGRQVRFDLALVEEWVEQGGSALTGGWRKQ